MQKSIIFPPTLRNILKGTNENVRIIMKIFEQHNDEVKSLIGKDFSAAELERYQTAYDHIKIGL